MSRLATIVPDLPAPEGPEAVRDPNLDSISTLGALVDSEWVTSFVSRQMNQRHAAEGRYIPWDPTPDNVKNLAGDLPLEYWDALGDAYSEEDAKRILLQQRGLYESRQKLQSLGIGGTALTVGANILDPTNLLLGLAVPGAGIIKNGGRLSRLAAGGVITAAGNLPIDLYRAQQDPDVDGYDVIYGVAGSFILGGGLNAALGRSGTAAAKLEAAAVKLQKGIELEQVKKSGATLTPKGRTYFRSQLEAEADIDKFEEIFKFQAELDITPDFEKVAIEDDLAALLRGPKRADTDPKAMLPEGVGSTSKEPWQSKMRATWANAAKKKTEEAEFAALPDDADIIVYHGTDEAGVVSITGSGKTTRPLHVAPTETDAKQYGDRVVKLVVRKSDLRSSPDFPDEHPIHGFFNSSSGATIEGRLRFVSDAPAQAIAKTPDPRTDLERLLAGETVEKLPPKVFDPEADLNARAAAITPEERLAQRRQIYDAIDAARQADNVEREILLGRLNELIADGTDVPTAVRKLYDEMKGITPPAKPGTTGPVFPDKPIPGGLGAASPSTIDTNITPPGPKDPTDLYFEPNWNPSGSDTPAAALGGGRWGIAGRLGSSTADTVRRLGTLLVEDVLPRVEDMGGFKGLRPVTLSASEWVSRNSRLAMGGFNRVAEATLDKRFKAKGTNVLNRWSRIVERDKIMESAGRAVRRAKGSHADADVNTIADNLRNQLKNLLLSAQRHGVPGFADIKINDTYLPRIFRPDKLASAIATHGEDQVERLIGEAIMKATPDIDPAKAGLIARGYLKHIQDLSIPEVSKATVLSADRADELAEILRANKVGTEAEISQILADMKLRKDGVNPTASSKKRLELEETHSITTAKGTLAFEDLLENNAETLMGMYSRQITGASAMESVYRGMSRSADDAITSDGALLLRARQDMIAQKVSPAEIGRTLDRLQTAIKSIRGMPLGSTSGLAHAGRMVRGFNYLVRGGGFVFAQAAEIGTVLANTGFTAALQSMPVLKTVLKRAQDGHLSDELLDELEVFVGVGTERLNSTIAPRLNQQEGLLEFGNHGIDRALARASRFSGDVTGFASLTTAMQRWSAAAAVQRWTNNAAKGVFPDEFRAAEMGMTVDEAKSVMLAMKQHASVAPSPLGRRVLKLNLDKWMQTDPKTASQFITAIDKWSRRVVQQNDIGQYANWMTSDFGRILIQFRSFTVAAYEKQLLRNSMQLKHSKDWDAFSAFIYPLFGGALAYTAMIHTQSIGRKDRDKFLKQRLSPEAIATAAFQRGAWSSIIPMGIDTITSSAGFDPLFSARTSGLESDPLFGNPTADLAINGRKAFAGLVAPFRSDYDFSQDDMRNLRKLIPFQNIVGIRNVLDAIQTDLPKRSKKQ